MKNISQRCLLAGLLSFTGNIFTASSDVTLPDVLSDGMVLQQNAKVTLWGKADPKEAIHIQSSWGASSQTTANPEGKWRVELTTPKGGDQVQNIEIKGNNTIQLKDILVGEVWLCSGQSNMAFTIAALKLPPETYTSKASEHIRAFKGGKNPSLIPRYNIHGKWTKAHVDHIPNMSGTAFFFAAQLREKLKVPIGIVNSSWGGTQIESWSPLSAQEKVPETVALRKKMDKWAKYYKADKAKKKFEEELAVWNQWFEVWKRKTKEERGPWKRKPEMSLKADLTHRYPGNLYRGMIHPLLSYRFRGCVWYQGEANTKSIEGAALYKTLLTEMVQSWRSNFKAAQPNLEELPFYVMQLPNFRAPTTTPIEASHTWPHHREAVRQASLEVPLLHMAVGIDIGEAKDIHPKNKMDVGKRLALLALKNSYQHEIISQGPTIQSVSQQGSNISLSFDTEGSSLKLSKGDHPMAFAVAGDDGVYHHSKAKITAPNQISLSCPEVPQIKSVKYAWADHPIEANLVNEQGLPAGPFTIDL